MPGNVKKLAKAPLQPLPLIDEPWTRVAVDVVGPLPRTKRGHTLVDFATRYPEAIPVRTVDAPTVTQAIMDMFSRFGLPDQLLSDNGGVFRGKLAQELMSRLGVKQLRTSPYRPQTNGMLERWHRTLKAVEEDSGI